MAKAKKEAKKMIDCDYVSHTACHIVIDGTEYNLVKGVAYTLPDCDFVRGLIAQNRLKIKD